MAAALGAGEPSATDEKLPADAEASCTVLRCALHLNLAAAALKLEALLLEHESIADAYVAKLVERDLLQV